MEAKNPDDIMAECLLRGGKMLSKACRACGSPLFEVKGETLCVVCREKGKEKGKPAGKPAKAAPPAETAGKAGDAGDPGNELRMAITVLARRAREEEDPGKAAALMEAAKRGAEALALLQR